jgi:hypothetical protein
MKYLHDRLVEIDAARWQWGSEFKWVPGVGIRATPAEKVEHPMAAQARQNLFAEFRDGARDA